MIGPFSRIRLGGLVALIFLASGCADTPLSSRYAAEKKLYRARKTLIRIANKPDAAGPLRAEAIESFESLLKDYPLQRAKNDREELRSLGEVRVASAVHLAALYRDSKEREKAIAVLSGMRAETRVDPDLALRIHGELIALLSRPLEPDSLILVLRSAAEDLAPATADGTPIPLVIEAPLQVVELLETTGQTTRAAMELDAARVYYEQVAGKYLGTEAEVVARIQLAKIELRQGHLQEADQILSAARALPAAQLYEGAILFSQGGVRMKGANTLRAAIATFRDLVQRYPEDRNAPEAILQTAGAFNALGQPDSALAALATIESKYPRDPNAVANSRLATARVLAQAKRWPDAVRTLRNLATDFPRTAAGLLGPLEIVAYYRESGQTEAMGPALREAANSYERLANELAKDPASHPLVTQALDHLAETYERLEDWPKAVGALLTRAQNFPDDARSPFAYVRASSIQEEKMKDRAGAIRTLELLAGRYPGLPLAEQAQAKIARLKGSS